MKNDPPIDGFVNAPFEPVRKAFLRNFTDDIELGAALAIYHHGEQVLHLWAGHKEPEQEHRWAADTLANVWSIGKGVSGLCAAKAVDMGLIEYDRKVAEYWPEFAAEGKGEVTVSELLSHQAGVPGTRYPCRFRDLFDWQTMADRYAATKPFWPPGTASGYHVFSFGFLAGELIRRTYGQSIGAFLRQEIAEPLGSDFYFGLPSTLEPRVSLIHGNPPMAGQAKRSAADLPSSDLDLNNMHIAGYQNPPVMVHEMNTRAWRAAEIPAINGQATADGVARLYAMLERGGTLEGTKIMSPETIALATTEQRAGTDLILRKYRRWGRGFVLNDEKLFGPNREAFGHAGNGNCLGFADPKSGIAVGYVLNRLGQRDGTDLRSRNLLAALYACL